MFFQNIINLGLMQIRTVRNSRVHKLFMRYTLEVLEPIPSIRLETWKMASQTLIHMLNLLSFPYSHCSSGSTCTGSELQQFEPGSCSRRLASQVDYHSLFGSLNWEVLL